MKIFKRISYIVVIIVALLIQVTAPNLQNNATAASKTLRTLKAELAQQEKELAENKHQQAATESEINASKRKVEQISKEKLDIEEEVKDLEASIKQLNKDIINMNQEIKDIMVYYQLSNTGDSAELEYIFTATDFTDFIYRMAIAEQLSSYNEETIKDYNQKIVKSENKKEQLADKKVELNKKEEELEGYIVTQQDKLTEVSDGALDIEEEIKATKKLINLYENVYKCKLDQTLEDCTAGSLPPGTAFYRPIVSGRVSSNFGPRSFMLNGKWTSDFHYGTDFASSHNTPIYSTANGVVAAVFKRQSCGGNMVYINHMINGKRYTSAYYHLASYNVKVGDVVNYNTVIGKMGGNPAYETWDRCSTGSHVHFSLSTGNWGTTFKSYSGFIARNFNPRNVVNMPALGKTFNSRTRKY